MNKRQSTDKEWEKWGSKDPYFGVITHNEFRSRNLTDEGKIKFFETGRDEIRHVLEVARRHLDPNFSPKKALDFGCGVGRLVLALAEIAEHVVGVDVSKSMLRKAHKNFEERSVRNVSLLGSDDNLSSLNGLFDFILSIIVFQHIPVERGRLIFSHLLEQLEDGGIGVIQITYAKTRYKQTHGVSPKEGVLEQFKIYKNRLKKVLRRRGYSLLRRPALGDPEMQMNPYNLNELLFQMQESGIRDFYAEFSDHGGELGVFLYFQKPKQSSP